MIKQREKLELFGSQGVDRLILCVSIYIDFFSFFKNEFIMIAFLSKANLLPIDF